MARSRLTAANSVSQNETPRQTSLLARATAGVTTLAVGMSPMALNTMHRLSSGQASTIVRAISMTASLDSSYIIIAATASLAAAGITHFISQPRSRSVSAAPVSAASVSAASVSAAGITQFSSQPRSNNNDDDARPRATELNHLHCSQGSSPVASPENNVGGEDLNVYNTASSAATSQPQTSTGRSSADQAVAEGSQVGFRRQREGEGNTGHLARRGPRTESAQQRAVDLNDNDDFGIGTDISEAERYNLRAMAYAGPGNHFPQNAATQTTDLGNMHTQPHPVAAQAAAAVGNPDDQAAAPAAAEDNDDFGIGHNNNAPAGGNGDLDAGAPDDAGAPIVNPAAPAAAAVGNPAARARGNPRPHPAPPQGALHQFINIFQEWFDASASIFSRAPQQIMIPAYQSNLYQYVDSLVPSLRSAHNTVPYRTDDEFDLDLNNTRDALETLLAGATSASNQASTAQQNPLSRQQRTEQNYRNKVIEIVDEELKKFFLLAKKLRENKRFPIDKNKAFKEFLEKLAKRLASIKKPDDK